MLSSAKECVQQNYCVQGLYLQRKLNICTVTFMSFHYLTQTKSYNFFRFACRMYSTVGASLAIVQQQCSSLTAPQFDGKNPNASEGSVFLVTPCSLISGSSAKDILQALHTFVPFGFPKTFLLQILKCLKSPFVLLKELVELFFLEKVSYLWTNENTFFQFCLTQSGELFS